MHETFDHTADIGLRIRAASLGELFADAGRALFCLMVANLDAVLPAQPVEFEVAGDRYDDLLCDWLAELLYTFDTRRMLFSRFDVDLDSNGLKATGYGEPIDPARHQLDKEVKAITYHGLKVEPDGPGWLGEVIVDI